MLTGQGVRRTEDRDLLTGRGGFVDDIPLEGALHAIFVRSPVAHGRIEGIDAAEARSMPGVAGVFTAGDLELGTMPGGRRGGAARPVLASETVRFAGEPVAVVVAASRAQAVDAAERVLAAIDPLPPVTDPGAAETAIAQDADPAPELFAEADVVVRARLRNQRVAPVPMEANGCAAAPAGDGLAVWASTQIPHRVRDALAATLALSPDAVRVVAPAVGGGFGAKKLHPEYLVVAALTRRLGRPVRWTETRSENLVAMTHGRDQIQDVELGARRDGRVVGLRARVTADSGANAGGVFTPALTGRLCPGVYTIPKVEFSWRAVTTNTTPVSAYRGAGRPEAAALIERAMDMLACELGMDPVELRRRNLIPADAFPYTTATGLTYDSGDYGRALDEVLRLVGYEGLRAEQATRRRSTDARQLGVGVSLFVETSGGGTEFGSVDVGVDGRVTVLAGTSAHGQGHRTAYAQVAADALGVPYTDVEVVESDTALVPRGRGTMGSRSMQMAGSAIHGAAEEIVEKARSLAAELLEVAPEDIVRSTDGRFGVAGVPGSSVGWAELAAACIEGGERLAAYRDFAQEGPTFPFGAHAAVVEVDTETGAVELVRFVAVDDCGRQVNPMLVRGQVHGGVAQGIAQALYEEVLYDPDGNPLTSTLATYGAPAASELPALQTADTETPSPRNPLGAKGVGESGTIGAPPAVQNAVVDALSHLGVRHIDMPLTPERVWRAIPRA